MDKDVRKIIAKNICGLRKQNKMTQAELAEKLFYSDKAVSKWERGDALPDAECLYRIATLFGVEIQFLFTENDFTATTNREEETKLEKKEIGLKLLFIFSLFFISAIIILNIVFSFLDKVHAHHYAMPLFIVSLIPAVLLIFNNVLGRKKFNLILISVTIWTITEAFYLLFYDFHLDGLYAAAMFLNAGFILWPRLSGTSSLPLIRRKKKNEDEIKK